MKLVHFDSQPKSTFILWLRAHKNTHTHHSFQTYYVLLISLSSVRSIKKWFVSVDVSNRADFVWMNKWMVEWMRSRGRCIYGFSNCSLTSPRLGNSNAVKWHTRFQCNSTVLDFLYGNPCTINSFHAFPFGA